MKKRKRYQQRRVSCKADVFLICSAFCDKRLAELQFDLLNDLGTFPNVSKYISCIRVGWCRVGMVAATYLFQWTMRVHSKRRECTRESRPGSTGRTMIFDLLRQRRKMQPIVQMKSTTRSFLSFASSPKFERGIELRLRHLTSKFQTFRCPTPIWICCFYGSSFSCLLLLAPFVSIRCRRMKLSSDSLDDR